MAIPRNATGGTGLKDFRNKAAHAGCANPDLHGRRHRAYDEADQPAPMDKVHKYMGSRAHLPTKASNNWRSRLGLLGLSAAVFLVVLQPGPTAAQSPPADSSAKAEEAPAKMPADQLDALVAPIALYPDSLLAQTLVASTYPLEIVQLQQWMAKNPGLKDKELEAALAKQPWDPSIQSMAAVPEVVKRLADDIQWTTELGNAFLAQQSDVMDAVQRMRKKAKDKGALASNEQQKVETQTEGDKTVIVVQSTNPEVVYVPSYSPTVVYGPPVYPYYPYPPIYYPPYPAGAAFVSFSFGVMIGAAWGGACCGMGWSNNNININNNNNFNRVNHNNIGNGNRGNGNRGNGNWQHNPQHRGGAPYGDRATANKFGGTTRGDSLNSRQTQARQQGGAGTGNRAGGAGVSDRAAGGGGLSDRSGGGGAGDRPSAGSRDVGGGDRGGAGGRDSGGRSSSNRSSGGGFGGSSGGGFSGSSARSSSSRGASSFGGGGGGRRGGGGGGRRR
jgi:hypothetical protein